MADEPTDRDAPPVQWTLGDIKARNLQLEAICRTPGCNTFVSFDLDKLIESAGPDYQLPDSPGVPCPKCGSVDMAFQLAYLHPDGEKA
jgi:hypothetical protein